MKKLFKTCDIYRRPNAYYVFPVIRTLYGGITIPPATEFTPDVTASELNKAIIQILEGLPDGITQVDLATAREPFLAFLKERGFRNVGAFERNAAVVAVHYDGGGFDVVAHRKDRRGANVATESIRLPPEQCERVGETVLAAFQTRTEE